ncbi:MAG: cytochrome b [Gammaproteobacteria bacterium]|nr:cytochrome b [Gammaproteobacteria bacterium]NNJ83879.1 cytochrome b [Gammaproteobacteria bacterium]
MFTNTSTTYAPLFKLLHWLMAVIIIALLGVGLYMTGLPDEAPNRADIYGLHKAMGTLTFMLVVVRLLWILGSPPPMLPAVFNAKEQVIVKGIKSILYLLMVLVPVSGYTMSTAAGYAVSFFGLFELPKLIAESKAIAGFAHEMHEVLGFVMIFFVLLHVAGAVKHRIKDKNGESDLLARML